MVNVWKVNLKNLILVEILIVGIVTVVFSLLIPKETPPRNPEEVTSPSPANAPIDDKDKIILELYDSQLTTHIEAMVGIFFGLFANLFFITEIQASKTPSLEALVIFSLIYWLIAFGGAHFYIRLFEAHYFSEMLQRKIGVWDLRRTYENDNMTKMNAFFDKLIKFDKTNVESDDAQYNKLIPLLGLILYLLMTILGFVGSLI